MNIYLPVETKSRELESKMLLALEAVARGHEVLVGPLSIIFSWGPIGLLKPGVFHDKSLTPSKSKIRSFQKIKDRGSMITTLDEEGGFLTETFDLFGSLRYSSETLSLVDKVFFWGDFDFNWVNANFSNWTSKYEVTGSPRVDLWNFDRELKELNRQENEEYILIVSNFGYVLNQNRFWHLIDNYRSNNYLNDNFSIAQLTDRYSFQVALFGEFVQLIEKLSKSFPEKRIIIRPHPIEDKNAWKSFIKDLNNVEVVFEGSIDDWITNASLVIHNSCTSAFEAGVKGTPIIAYSPKESKHEKKISNLIGFKASDIESALSLSQSILEDPLLKSEKISANGDQLIKTRLHNNMKAGAFKKIVDNWEELDNGALNIKNDWQKISLRLYLSSLKKRFVKTKSRNTASSSFSVGHKFVDLKKFELENLVHKLSPYTESSIEVEIKRIYKKTFVLRAKR